MILKKRMFISDLSTDEVTNNVREHLQKVREQRRIRLTVGPDFNSYILTRPEYSISISWPGSVSTSSHDSIRVPDPTRQDELGTNMFKYMIPIIEIIQQRILHHEELDELKAAEDSDVVNEFDKFMSTFSSDKNAGNREILNSLTSANNELKDLIKVDDNEIDLSEVQQG